MNQKNRSYGWVYLSLLVMILSGSCGELYAKKKKKRAFVKQVREQVAHCIDAVSAENVYTGISGLCLYMALISTYQACSETLRAISAEANRPYLTPRMLLAYWSISGCYGIFARQAYAKAVDEQDPSDDNYDNDDDYDDFTHHLKPKDRT